MTWVITPSTKVPVDPFRSQVSLLLHGDGLNGSTTIIDSSPTPKTVTAVGNAQISTAQSRYSGSSVAFDGNGDYLSIASNEDFRFGLLDFTIEAWIYSTSIASQQTIIDMRPTNDNGAYVFWAVTSTGALNYYVNTGDRIISGPGAISANTWTHIVVSRSGGSTRMFVTGSQVGATYIDSTNYLISSPRIGQSKFAAFPENFIGYIDELRITKGVARYTANFTPPTTPFPDI